MKIELLFFLLSGKNDVLRCGMTQELSAKNPRFMRLMGDFSKKRICHFFFHKCMLGLLNLFKHTSICLQEGMS